jgi:hypothetical protein
LNPLTLTLSHKERGPIEPLIFLHFTAILVVLAPNFPKLHDPTSRSGQLPLTLSHKERGPIEPLIFLHSTAILVVLAPNFPKLHDPTTRSRQLPRPVGEGWGEGQKVMPMRAGKSRRQPALA